MINADPDREYGMLNGRMDEISHADFDIKNELLNRRQNEMKQIKKKKVSFAIETEQQTNDKRRNDDRFYIQVEKGDSEVIVLYKEIMKCVFLPAALLMGVRFNYSWNPLRHGMFWLAIGSLVSTWFCFLYTQYVHLTSQDKEDKMRVLEVFGVYGLGLSVYYFWFLFVDKFNFCCLYFLQKCIIKMVNYLTQFKSILALVEFMLKICRQNSTGRRAYILKKELRKFYSSLNAFTICVIANLAMFISVPFATYFINKELISLVPIKIAYVDENTFIGYLTINLAMSVSGLLAHCGTVFCASLFILLISNFSIQVELIGDDFNYLDKMWADKRQSLGYRRALLRNICMRCQDMDNYIVEVKKVFEEQMFAFFCGAYFSQIICLFEIAKNNWIPGYAIALLLFEEIMYYCYVGTQKNIANQRLCGIICDTNWYEYDAHSQKLLLMLLHSCQNSSELRIGPLAAMNLTTGVEILKSIYSYYTILKELL